VFGSIPYTNTIIYQHLYEHTQVFSSCKVCFLSEERTKEREDGRRMKGRKRNVRRKNNDNYIGKFYEEFLTSTFFEMYQSM
jgi:hypothetical protein